MKLIAICLLFAFSSLCNLANAQTGKEALQACITAMKIDKMVDSFQTMSVKTYIYQQGQKIIFKVYNKETAEKENLYRFEQSLSGKEEAYVYSEADEEFFKVAPQYEELDQSDCAFFFQIISMMFPQIGLPAALKDTTGKVMVDIVGTEEFNGRKCKKIGLAIKDENDTVATADKPEYGQYLYTDEVSNFLYGVEMPESKLKLMLENMKKVKGVVYPATIKVMINDKKQTELEIDQMEVNVEFEDSLFSKPN